MYLSSGSLCKVINDIWLKTYKEQEDQLLPFRLSLSNSKPKVESKHTESMPIHTHDFILRMTESYPRAFAGCVVDGATQSQFTVSFSNSDDRTVLSVPVELKVGGVVGHDCSMSPLFSPTVDRSVCPDWSVSTTELPSSTPFSAVCPFLLFLSFIRVFELTSSIGNSPVYPDWMKPSFRVSFELPLSADDHSIEISRIYGTVKSCSSVALFRTGNMQF